MVDHQHCARRVRSGAQIGEPLVLGNDDIAMIVRIGRFARVEDVEEAVARVVGVERKPEKAASDERPGHLVAQVEEDARLRPRTGR